MACGCAISGLASIRTRRILRYRPGQGAECRFTALYDEPAVGNSMLAGLANSQNSLLFGYFGVTTGFGILHGNSGVCESRSLTINTKSSASQNATVTLGGVSFVVPVTNGADTAATAWDIASGVYNTIQPGWQAQAIGSTVVFRCLTTGPQTGSFGVSFPTNGSGTFSIVTTGVSPNNIFIPQSSWNIDTLDGTGGAGNPSTVALNPQKGNVYAIQYQYLGFGAITFKVENPSTGELVHVHRIKYSNTDVLPSMSIPSYFFSMSSRNVGNNTSKKLYSASTAGFVEGQVRRLGTKRNHRITKTVGTTLVPLFSLKNIMVFRGKININEVIPLNLMATNTSTTRSVELVVVEGGRLNNAASFSQKDSNSKVLIDSSATSYSEGVEVFGGVVGVTNTMVLPLSAFNIALEPTDTMIIAARTLAGTADVSVSLQWDED